MEWARSQLLAVLGTLLVILIIFLWNNRKAQSASELLNDSPDAQGMLCRFVRHDADVIGETVAQEGDQLIVKQAGVFKSIPLAQVKDVGGELVLQGTMDWEASLQRGQGWLERVRKGDADAVAGQLTRSQDVQNPALRALQEREEE